MVDQEICHGDISSLVNIASVVYHLIKDSSLIPVINESFNITGASVTCHGSFMVNLHMSKRTKRHIPRNGALADVFR